MRELDELQRLAGEAADEAEGDWFCSDLLEPGAPPILATTKARAFMHAMSPDTAKKLIAVALAAERALPCLDYPGPSWHENRAEVAASLRTALDAIRNEQTKEGEDHDGS